MDEKIDMMNALQQPRYQFFTVIIIMLWGPRLIAQEAILTTPFPIQSFYCGADGEILNVVYKNQNDQVAPIVNPSKEPYHEIMLHSDGQKFSFNHKEHVVWSDQNRIITEYNDFDFYAPEGRLYLYQIDGNRLTKLKDYNPFNGNNLFCCFPDKASGYFVLTDTNEGAGSTVIKILDTDLNEKWSGEYYEKEIQNFQVEQNENLLSITYISFPNSGVGGILYWILFDTSTGMISSEFEFDIKDYIINSRKTVEGQLFFSFHTPKDRTFGYKIIDEEGKEVFYEYRDMAVK